MAWVAAEVIGFGFLQGGPELAYPALVTATIIGTGLAMLLVPILAAFGWRRAPLVSLIGSLCGLVSSYWDARFPSEHGLSTMVLFAALLVVSVGAVWNEMKTSVRANN